MRREAMYLGVLAALAALSTWFLSSLESSLRSDNVKDDTTPMLYMDNFSAVRMDEHGFQEYTVRSPHLVQLPADQGTWVEQPDMDVFKDDIRMWMIRSRRGWISTDNSVIRLQGNVSMTRPVSSGEQPVVITTRHMLLRPDDNYAETPAAVKMESASSVVTGVGLKVYLAEQRLELLSEVRGRYEPPKQ